MLFLAGRRAGLGVGFSVKGMGGQLARVSLSGGGNGSEMPNVLPKTPVSLFLAGKEGNVQKTTGEYFGTGKIVAV